MASKFWNGYSWRRISNAEARLRRARGERVIDAGDPEPEMTPPPVDAVPAPPPAPPLPPSPPMAPPATPGPPAARVAAPPPPPAPAPLPGLSPAAERVERDDRLEQPGAVVHVDFKHSSNLRAATLATDGTVTVEFANGTVYRYGGFTAELMQEWQDAKSAGGWFHQHVRQKPERHPVLDEGTVNHEETAPEKRHWWSRKKKVDGE